VKNSGESNLAAEFLTTEMQQGFRCGSKEQTQKRTLIVFTPTNERIQLMREGEYIVEVWHGQQLALAGGQPIRFGLCLALGTVPITTTVVVVSLKATLGTPLTMSSQFNGATLPDVPQCLPLSGSQSMIVLKVATMLSYDIRQFDGLLPRHMMPCG
jgi:hypothetical protein